MGRTCAVLGSPITHSLSPQLHRVAYRELGLDWTYERHEVTEPDLAGFIGGLDPSWRGLSLTMPLKFVVLDLARPDDLVLRVGAANTLILDWDGGPHRAHNTDVPGMVAAVRSAGGGPIDRAVVLGSGATARSSIASLGLLGCTQATVVARTPAKAEDLRGLATDCGMDLEVRAWTDQIPDSDLLISTVTSGAADPLAGAAAASAPLLFDVLYDPWPTALAAAAGSVGVPVVNGLDLLAHQAVGQVELMTGRTVDARVLVRTGRELLAARSAAPDDH